MRTRLLLWILPGLACGAAPYIDPGSVTFTQDPASRVVTATYRLAGDAAIVTMGVETNDGNGAWIDIGAEHVTRLAGPVNKVVQPDASAVRTVKWGPDLDWPDMSLSGGKARAVFTAWPTNDPPPYMAVELATSNAVYYYASEAALPLGVSNRLWKTEMMLMRRIRAVGVEWCMGAPTNEPGGYGTISPSVAAGWAWTLETPHRVTLTRDYYIGVYPITQFQWTRVMNASGAYFTTCESGDIEQHPMDRVLWSRLAGDADSMVVRMRAVSGLAGFNVPTCAEWEFACRAGARTGLYSGEELDLSNLNSPYNIPSERLGRLAWYKNNSGERTHAVGGKLPNRWGLYDMLGNVEEMTRDYHKADLGTEDQVDPEYDTPQDYNYRSTCGGHFNRDAYRIRCCCRNAYSNPAAANCVGGRLICYIYGN